MLLEDKEAWLKALRSGEYEQTKHTLRNDQNQFCCLGVLCEILKDECDLKIEVDNVNIIFYNEAYSKLPEDIIDRTRINYDLQNKLIKLNDNEDKNFNEIANWIEKNIPIHKKGFFQWIIEKFSKE